MAASVASSGRDLKRRGVAVEAAGAAIPAVVKETWPITGRGKEEVPDQAVRTDIITANRPKARSESRGRKRGIQRRVSEAKAQVRSVERRTDRKMNFGGKACQMGEDAGRIWADLLSTRECEAGAMIQAGSRDERRSERNVDDRQTSEMPEIRI